MHTSVISSPEFYIADAHVLQSVNSVPSLAQFNPTRLETIISPHLYYTVKSIGTPTNHWI